jgi:hypothetical protein
MKKLIPIAVVVAASTFIQLSAGTAWASKNCPDGSHAGKGPDPKMVYCYDNDNPDIIVKIIPA